MIMVNEKQYEALKGITEDPDFKKNVEKDAYTLETQI